MRRHLHQKLDYKERQWLYKAIAQMVVADKVVDKAELDDFKEALCQMYSSEGLDYRQVLTSPEFSLPLKPMLNIKKPHCLIIFGEIARIAAIDSKVVEQEKVFFGEIMELLGFSEQAKPKLLAWVEDLAKVLKQEQALYKNPDQLF